MADLSLCYQSDATTESSAASERQWCMPSFQQASPGVLELSLLLCTLHAPIAADGIRLPAAAGQELG